MFSIARLQEAVQKKGCRNAVFALMTLSALALAGSGFWALFSKRSQTGEQGAPIIVATIDGQDLTAVEVEDQVRRLQEQYGLVSDPFMEFQIRSMALGTIVSGHVVTGIANSRGLTIDDAKALALASDQIDQAITQFRQQATTEGKLKPGATEQEFQDFFKKDQGQTTAEFKDGRVAEIKSVLADPLKRTGFIAGFYQQALQDDFYKKTLVTDDEVKKSYDNFVVKVISFDKPGLTAEKRKSDAEAALVAIKGGAKWEDVMMQHMQTPAKEPLTLGRQTLAADEGMASILNLKPGEVSGVVTRSGSPSIYQLVEIKSSLPKDFESSKALYSDQFKRNKAMDEMRKVLDAAMKNAKIEWKSEGYSMLYQMTQIASQSGGSDADVKAKYLKIIGMAPDPAKDPAGASAATLARFAAAETLRTMLTGQEQKDFLPQYVEVLNAILDTTENIDLRLRMVDVYEQLGDFANVAVTLKTAASLNNGFEVQNQAYFDQINRKLTELENAKKLDAAAAQGVREELLRWSREKAEADAAKTDQTSELDEFTIDPKTGKTLKQLADEKAKQTLDKANAPTEAKKK